MFDIARRKQERKEKIMNQQNNAFSLEVAESEFARRYKENQGKQIDNNSLPAGSPIYFYCRGCGVSTDTLPEGYWLSTPNKICVPCDTLEKQGVLDRLVKEIKND